MAKTRSASRSMKERLERARALESLKRARALKGQGLNIEAAIAKSIAESKKTGVTGKPFLIYREDAETIMKRHVDSKILPGKIDEVKLQLGWLYRSTLGFKKNNAKEELVNRLFGKKGKFGLLMVKPELYFKARQIKSLLEQMGFETVFLKTFVFNRQTLLRQYPHVLKDRETYWKFSLGAGGLLSGPSRVIIFRFPSEKEKVAGAAKHPQDAFNALVKKRIREGIARPNLERHGIAKGGTSIMDDIGKNLDLFGFFEKNSGQGGIDPLIAMNGIHVPDSTEILQDARTLLSFTELKNLDARKFGG